MNFGDEWAVRMSATMSVRQDDECEDECKDDSHPLNFFTEIHVGDPLASLFKLLVSECNKVSECISMQASE